MMRSNHSLFLKAYSDFGEPRFRWVEALGIMRTTDAGITADIDGSTPSDRVGFATPSERETSLDPTPRSFEIFNLRASRRDSARSCANERCSTNRRAVTWPHFAPRAVSGRLGPVARPRLAGRRKPVIRTPVGRRSTRTAQATR